MVNREHPLVKKALQADAVDIPTLRSLLRLIEEYIPIQQIWVDAAEGDETQTQPFEHASSEELIGMIQMIYRAHRISGLSHAKALERLSTTEAFGDRHELIEVAVESLPAEVTR